MNFGVRKLESKWRNLRNPTFSRFDTIPECGTHTHTQTSDTRLRHIPSLAKRSAVKTVLPNYSQWFSEIMAAQQLAWNEECTSVVLWLYVCMFIFVCSYKVCRPSAGTSYDHTVRKIWSLYVNSLQRYERRRKMQKLGCFGELGVTKGHRKHSHLIEHIRLPIRL